VEAFRGRHADRAIIPISVDGALQDKTLTVQAQEWLEFGDKIWLYETDDAVTNGIASKELVERLALAPAGRSSNTKWRWVVRAIVAVLTVLTLAAIGFGIYAQTQRGKAQKSADEAMRQGDSAEKNAKEAKKQEGIAKTQEGIAKTNEAEARKQEGIAKQETATAERNARESKARELAAYANGSLGDDPEKSTLLGMQAVNATFRFRQTLLPAAEEALHQAILASQVRMTLRGHSDRAWSVAYSPDGKCLATASGDKTAKVWDAESGKELQTLRGHTDAVRSVAYSPDGTRLATPSYDGTTQVYAIDIHELLNLARSRVTRDLTPDECRQYFQSEKCPAMP
jgi:hypothetical protein